jgi:hypothetical protein
MSLRRRNHLLWIGPLLTFVGGVTYFLYFARIPALRDVPWVNLPLVLGGLVLSLVAVGRGFARRAPYRGKVLGSLGAVFSLLIASLFTMYIFVWSYGLPAPGERTLSLGTAPDFILTDQHGAPVSLADLRGRKVVLTFYRGHW